MVKSRSNPALPGRWNLEVASRRTRWRNGGDVWGGGGATNASPDHRRADEVSDTGGLDRHGGNGTVRPDLQKLRTGDGALSRTGSHSDRGAVRERAGLFVAGVAGERAANETVCLATSLGIGNFSQSRNHWEIEKSTEANQSSLGTWFAEGGCRGIRYVHEKASKRE